MKPLNFIGSSLDGLRTFPDEARKASGFELYCVQRGLEPTDWKPIIKTSGNVFLELGFSPEDAAILQMRSEIMADLRKFIKNKKLTQAKAAEILSISQSRVSDLIRGKREKFSLEMLIAFVTKAGMRISLKRSA